MAKDRCRYHPDQISTGTCKQCGVPICDGCKVARPEGIFCSEVCWDNFTKFQDRLSAHRPMTGQGSMLRSLKFWIFIAAIAFFGTLFLKVRYGLESLGDLPSALSAAWADLMSLF